MKQSSIWLEAKKPIHYGKLPGSMTAEVVVVGGGIAGVTAAYLLAQAGKKVLLVEKDEIGYGVTGYTTAMLTQNIDLDLVGLTSLFPKEAKRIWESGAMAIDFIEGVIKKEKIDCDFERCDYFVYATDQGQQKDLEEEVEAGKKIEVEIEMKTGNIPISNSGYLQYKRQAKFHPLKYVWGVVKAAKKMGLLVFEKTEITDVMGSGPVMVKTAGGAITAEKVIMTTHLPLRQPVQLFFKKGVYTSYMISGLLKKGVLPEVMFEDMYQPYHYFRVDSEGSRNRITLGGADHRSQVPMSSETCYAELKDYLHRLLPGVEVEITHQWDGPIIETADGLPYIGTIGDNKAIGYATGFSGNGMTFGTLAGMILSDAMTGKKNELGEIYSADRIPTLKQVGSRIRDFTSIFFGGFVKNTLKYLR